jgi:replication factor C subunit 1
MDEVDGMSGNGERGGMADLIETIKISKIPIICICNDQYNTKVKALINHCLDLKFSKPVKTQVAKRMIVVASSEGLTVDQVRSMI